jgi:hypothetical protein
VLGRTCFLLSTQRVDLGSLLPSEKGRVKLPGEAIESSAESSDASKHSQHHLHLTSTAALRLSVFELWPTEGGYEVINNEATEFTFVLDGNDYGLISAESA